MTHLTPITAKDELYKFVHDRFAAYLATNNVTCEIRWQGKLEAANVSNVWVRFSMQQVLSTLKAYAEKNDESDDRVYETSGLFFAQVNIAMSEADSFRRGDLLATALVGICRDADTPSGLWLRNVRFNELPSDGQFYKWNVIAEYEYDETQ